MRILALLGAMLFGIALLVGYATDKALAYTPVDGAPLGFGIVCSPIATEGMYDPIVYPGQTDITHNHSFFGATNVNPNSTNDSLRTSESTTCKVANDKASYWLPAANVPVRTTIAYYKPVPQQNNGFYNVFSDDLKMIAGSVPMDGSTTPDPNVKFGCQGEPAANNSQPVDCGTDRAKVEIEFPNCQKKDTNGVLIDDSTNHRSHMAYANPKNGSCPSTHPYKVTKLNIHVIYEATDGRQIQWSVPWYDLHADFMNGEVNGFFRQAINDCITNQRYGCQRISD